ncbi:MAG: carbamoyltransferase [Lentisphaerae bacterium]|nr:carbamoyltransferase [Lentisphaerota bacterium]
MSKATLGISCFYHDAAAALVVDGNIVAAAQEERFTRVKADPSFPVNAISYCLEEGGIEAADLDSVVFYDKPMLTFDRLVGTYMETAPRGLSSWLEAAPEWSARKLRLESVIRRALGYDGKVLYVPHHLAHAASAYLPSPFDEAAILTVDGVGEWATATLGVGEADEVQVTDEMHFPDSIGLLYSAFTYFCGFKVNSGEYKLMGLAPYGRPVYAGVIRRNMIRERDDGSVELNLDFFGYLDGLEMITGRFADLFGGPRRMPEARITRREMDIARSIQVITEDVVLRMARELHRKTGLSKLCLAGGVALNCVANGRILREGPFERLWIQPAAGDAGGALGAALAVQFGWHGCRRPASEALDRQRGSYLGPAFSTDEVVAYLDGLGVEYTVLPEDERAVTVARAIAAGGVVGFLSGRMEFGPRALGARSILGDPRRADTQSVMNLKIKYRESFRPFAPSVLAERCRDYFDLDAESPYMLLVAPVREDRRVVQDDDPGDDLIMKVNRKRSDIPSVTHVDYSARVQTVHKETNPVYHAVLTEFEKMTGCAVVVNTSFNVRGEPIVCTPADAYLCFMRTEMDYLYMEGVWLAKTDQPVLEGDTDWRAQFQLD